MAKKQTGTLLDFFKGEFDHIEAVGKIDGKKVYKSEDYVELTKMDAERQKQGVSKAEVGLNELTVPEFGPDSMLLRTPRDSYQVNERIYFANAIEADKETHTITLVKDYRAITEKTSGLIYATGVVGYKIGRTDEGNYAVLEKVIVSEEDFVKGYHQSLSGNDIKMMFEVIDHYESTHANSGVALDDLFA